MSLPVLALKDVVLFPGTTAPLFIGRKESLAALSAARNMGSGDSVLLVTQKKQDTTKPKIADLYKRAYLYDLTKMDSEGKPTSSDREYTGSKTSYDPEGKTIMTDTGYLSDCSGITTLRYSIAVQPYKVIVPMTITDITLDGF